MNLQGMINQFYYEMSLWELRMMNDQSAYPDISYNSLLYLDIISCKENCTASFLADSLHVSRPGVTSKINELIRQGFVVKTQSTQDKRMNYLTLNEGVKAHYEAYDRCLSGAIKQLEEKYTQKELDTFGEMLAVLKQGYDAHLPFNPQR